MTWYDSDWTHREAIAVDNTSGASTIDISCALPSDWGFWDTVKADGSDIRLTAGDGLTLLSHQLSGWNATNKTGTIEIDDYTVGSSDAIIWVWLYYGNAAATSVADTFTVSSAKTGNVEPVCNVRPVFRAGSLAPGRTQPADQIAKSTDETIHVYLDFAGMLNRRCERVNGSVLGEEIDYVTAEVKLNGVAQASMIDLTKTRFIQPSTVQLHITGGADGSDYTITTQATTSKGRTLNPRILLRVKDV